MPKMAVAMARAYLSPGHAVADIRVLDHVLGIERLGEARPAGAAFELVERSKERLAGDNVHVDARLLVVPIRVIEGPLRRVPLRHAILLGRKAGNRFGIFVVFRHFLVHLGFERYCAGPTRRRHAMSTLPRSTGMFHIRT